MTDSRSGTCVCPRVDPETPTRPAGANDAARRGGQSAPRTIPPLAGPPLRQGLRGGQGLRSQAGRDGEAGRDARNAEATADADQEADVPEPGAQALMLRPVLTKRWLSPDAWRIDVYEQLDGYLALRKALAAHPDDLIALVKAAGLRGGAARVSRPA